MYLIINGRKVDVRLTQPDLQAITDALDDFPARVNLPDTKDMNGGEVIAWVSDDMSGREHRGEITRQIVGSTLIWSLGGERKPYAGTIVLTGASDSPYTGPVPVQLGLASLYEMQAVFYDIDAVLHGEAANPALPDALAQQFRDDAARIEAMPHEGSIWEDKE